MLPWQRQDGWERLTGVGDVDPIEHGGGMILELDNQVRLEYLEPQNCTSDPESTEWLLYEVDLDPIEDPQVLFNKRDLKSAAESMDMTVEEYTDLFKSVDPMDRYNAYQGIADIWGWHHFDPSPHRFVGRENVPMLKERFDD